MKAEELMIGDYVQLNGSPYVIEEISKKGWVHMTDPVHNLRVQMSTDYILDFIEGVQLTHEIMELNDIKYQRGMPWFQGGFDGKFELRYHDGDSINDTTTDITLTIRYVHELQHALRLCGIEKDLKLEP